jgi:type IV secretion system protein VirB6
MDQTPFENMSSDLGAAFSTGLSNVTSNALSAVSGPLSTLVVLWVIVQGILVMRGDVDMRSGITRMIRVTIIVGLLTSSGLYAAYVQTLFTQILPNWVASSITNANAVTNTPQAFDQIWNTTVHQIALVQAQLNFYDLVDSITLSMIEIIVAVLLLVTFAIFEIAQIMTGVIAAIGPFVLAGYLFDATRGIAERWLGKLIGLSLLTLLINVVLNVILAGERLYLRVMVNNPSSGTGAIPYEIQLLIEVCMFFAIGAVITVGLPATAAAIGGGVGMNAGAIGRSIVGFFDSGAKLAARGSVGAGEAARARYLRS